MSSATSQTALEQNKHLLVRWFDEVWNQGRRETIHELLAPECVIHDSGKTYRGPEEFIVFHDVIRSQLSNFNIQPVLMLAENDLVSMSWTAHCVHTPSGKAVQVTGISNVRVRNDKFVEAWQNWDTAGLEAQIASFSAR